MANATEQAAPKAKGGVLGKLVIGCSVVLVIGLETGAAFLLVPSPTAVSEQVRAEIQAAQEAGVLDADLLTGSKDGKMVEVELGDFSITVHHQASETSYTISCKVIGTVDEREQGELTTLLELNKARLRERITVEFRNAEITDLADSELGLIKRRILEKSNALFGKPLLRSVLLPDFNYYQQ